MMPMKKKPTTRPTRIIQAVRLQFTWNCSTMTSKEVDVNVITLDGSSTERTTKATETSRLLMCDFILWGGARRSILEIALDDCRYRYLHKNRLFVLHSRRAVVLPHPLQSMQSNSFGYNVTPRATSPEKCRNNIPLCTKGRREVMKTNIN